MSALAIAAVVGYAAATALHAAFLAGRSERAASAGRLLLAAGWLAHAADIGTGCVGGRHPAHDPAQAMLFAAWLFVGAHLALSLRHRVAAAGVVVAPAALALALVAHLVPGEARPSAQAASVLGRVHISLATVGVALFALAAALAALYLLEERQLKRKQLGLLLSRGLPLTLLDGLANTFVVIGFPIFTVALVLGVLWSVRLPAGRAPLAPQLGLALVTWAAFAWLLLGRLAAGWRGRRAARLTLVGFAAALAALGAYLLRRALMG